MLKKLQASIRLVFSGIFGQFNIFVLISLVFMAVMFFMINSSTDGYMRISGNIMLAFMIIAVLISSFVFYLKKQPRSDASTTPSMHLEIQGRQVVLKNPPDIVFQPQHMIQLLRLLMSGYDEDLLADGEIIGDAKDGNIRIFSDAEKMEFKEKNLTDIGSAKKMIEAKLEQTEQEAQ